MPAFAAAQVPDDLPTAAPYVRVDGRFHASTKIASQADKMRSELQRNLETPDFVLVWPDGPQSDGTTLTPFLVGGFITFDSATRVSQSAHAIGYRITPAALGVSMDAEGWLLRVSDTARAAGLLEGDRVTHIDGRKVRGVDAPFAWAVTLLDRQPGDLVHVEWIRSGTGVLEADVPLEPNCTMPDYGPTIDAEHREMMKRRWQYHEEHVRH